MDRGLRQTMAPPQRPILPMASTTRGEMFYRTAAGPRTLHHLVLVCVCVRQDGEEVRLRSRTQTAAVKMSVHPGSPRHVTVLCVARHALAWSCSDETVGRQSPFWFISRTSVLALSSNQPPELVLHVARSP